MSLVLTALSSPIPLATAADWPQFLGPHRNSSAPDVSLATQWPESGPVVLWRKPVGQGWSGPVIQGEHLIAFHRLEDEEVVQCLDPMTGELRWEFRYDTGYRDDFGFDSGPRATPAIAEGRVYPHGADGLLHCLDLESGAKLWSVDTRQRFDSPKGFFGRVCSPLVEGNAVILAIGGKEGAGIVAFNRNSGELLWKATDEEAGYSSPVAASIGAARRILMFNRGGLIAIDPADGAVKFGFPLRSPIHASVQAATPLVIDDRIFLSSSYDTGAVLLEVRENRAVEVWASDDSLSNHYATSVNHDGFLYGFHGRQDIRPGALLRCVELSTGRVRWSHEGLGAGTVTLCGDGLLVLAENGELLHVAASPDRFTILNRAQVLGLDVRAHPAVAAGRMFARDKRNLIALDLPGSVRNSGNP
jgi:outer membrane protein assembly factor BamB